MVNGGKCPQGTQKCRNAAEPFITWRRVGRPKTLPRRSFIKLEDHENPGGGKAYFERNHVER